MPAENRIRELLERLETQIPSAHFVPTVMPDGSDAAIGLWVPFGEGFEIPAIFEYDGSTPFEWEMTIGVGADGRPRCLDFRCRNPAGVTPEAFHSFALGRHVEEGTLLVSRPATEIPRRFERWNSVDEARSQRLAVSLRLRQTRARARVVDDELLADVARIYRENIATGAPSKAVARTLNYSESRARVLVTEARKRKLLGPARPGRVGEYNQAQEGDER